MLFVQYKYPSEDKLEVERLNSADCADQFAADAGLETVRFPSWVTQTRVFYWIGGILCR